MKITKKYLQNIIAKELQGILREQGREEAEADMAREEAAEAASEKKAEGGANARWKAFTKKWPIKKYVGLMMKKGGLTLEQAQEAYQKVAHGEAPGWAAAVKAVKGEGGSAAPKPGRDMGQPTTTKTATGDAAKAQNLEKLKALATRSGLKGKYLAGFMAQVEKRGGVMPRGQRKGLIKNLLAKQQAGG